MEKKSFLASITIWGGLIALLPQLSELADKAVNSGALPPRVSMIVSAAGGAIAIIGRILATKQIKL